MPKPYDGLSTVEMFRRIHGEQAEFRLRHAVKASAGYRRFHNAWMHLRRVKSWPKGSGVDCILIKKIPSLGDRAVRRLMELAVLATNDRHVVQCCQVIKQEVSRGR